MNFIRFLITWLRRLPWSFSISLFVALIAWLAIVATVLTYFEASTIADAVLNFLGKFNIDQPGAIGYLLQPIPVFVEGVVILAILLAGLVGSYNFAAWITRRLYKSPSVLVHEPPAPVAGAGRALAEFMKARAIDELRIGIICAGGGAKGAYQAGALKAIYEFLEDNNGLDKVRMIAGTSIGSWNSMFWMAGLIKPPAAGEMSAHEAWWKQIRADRVVSFAAYAPLAKNYFLLTTPWQETFKTLFMDSAPVKTALMERLFNHPERAFHFYLTRSNVGSGSLEFATNNVNLPAMKRRNWKTGENEPLFSSDLYELIAPSDEVEVLERMRTAVFASMDLPPLFPYVNIGDEWFEDGGVVDNLPVRFATQIEDCNLVFILPLNASFETPVDHKSVIKRLGRVMEVRQGVLERESMKLTYLYNDLARLKNPQKPNLVSVFAICPEQPLAINTSEFWKTKEAGEAFDLMYVAAKHELQDKFLEATDPHALRMALVSPAGEITYKEDF